VTISTIWEPVLDAAGDSGGNGGSRGRGGRRSSSIIAGRRPAQRTGAKPDADESEASAAPAEESDEDRPRTPRRRRRTTAPKAEASTADKPSEEASAEEKPAPRRRRRTRAAEPEPEQEPAAEVEEPVAEAASEEEPEAVVETKAPTRRRSPRSTPKTTAPADGEVSDLRALVEEQGAILSEVRAGLLTLGGQLDRAAQKPRMGVFVDVPNLMYGQGPDEKPVNMGLLLEFLRGGRDIVRATAYSPVSDNPSEPLEQQKFVAPFVPYEYRIVTKPLKRFADGSIKGNFDVEMAIDMLTMADRLDIIAIVSGDADFARAVEVVQTRGVRVEVVAFAQSSSLEMRSLADRYVELGAVLDQLV